MVYVPLPPPENADSSAVARWVMDELQKLSRTLVETTALELRPVTRAPDRPREGMIVFADGTLWNPGAGAGSYEYRGGTWVKL